MRLGKKIIVCWLLAFLLINIMGCKSTNSYSTNFKKNGPWEGNVGLSWKSNSLTILGKLNYKGKIPIKEVRITADYKETALGLPEGYTLPYMRTIQKYKFKNNIVGNLVIYDKAPTYQKVKKLLTIDQAKIILNNLVFSIEYVDLNNQRRKINLVTE